MHTVSYPFSEYVIKLKVIHPIAHLNISVNRYYPWWQVNLTKGCQKIEYNRHWARPPERLSSITRTWKESICTWLVWTNAKKTAEKQTGPAEMNLTKDSNYTTRPSKSYVVTVWEHLKWKLDFLEIPLFHIITRHVPHFIWLCLFHSAAV